MVVDAAADSSNERAADDDGRESDELLGCKLGHFQILSRIGSGGMGSVYRALDESLQRYVALKVLRKPSGAANDAGLQSLFQEARAQARVNHPNVAHIYYVGSESDTPYLAMELLGSETLADRMKNGPLPFHLIVRYALQIAGALAAAAKFDIVHGDVKPANMLLADEQTVKLSDFGLAKRMSEVAGDVGKVVGTPHYMSPEATQGSETDHRSDMYSLGIALFEMTFGRLPYDSPDGDLLKLLQLHREAPVEFPDPWPSELPLEWRNLLAKLLEKAPDRRYAHFADLIEDLKRLEPATLPTASPLLRGLAWLFDGFLVSSPLMIIALVSKMAPGQANPLFVVSVACVAFAICLLQAWWGTTPGKRLFQICIVDQHGLLPRRSVLGVRAAFQFAWAWSIVLTGPLQLLGLTPLGQLIGTLVGLFILAEMVLVLVGKGRSIHDRILRTRVVLDARKR